MKNKKTKLFYIRRGWSNDNWSIYIYSKRKKFKVFDLMIMMDFLIKSIRQYTFCYWRQNWQDYQKRIVDDMNYPLDLVSTIRRIDWIKNFKLNEVIYMGDGIFDHYVMREVGYSIAPANADLHAKKCKLCHKT